MDVSKYSFVCQKAFHQGLQYARSFGHQYLEVEHVALALIRDGSFVSDAVDGSAMQQALKTHLNKFRKVYGTVSIKFGVRLDKALDQVEAEKAGGGLIEVDDLWPALVRQSSMMRGMLEGSQFAGQAASFSNTENVDIHDGDRDEAAESAQTDELADELQKVLEDFTVDLTAIAERGELDPVVGRDYETRRVIEILGRKKKNNPILIGEPGVGKTAVAEALAQRIIEGRVPEPIKGKRILSLDVGGLIAGAKFRGEFEERIKNLLKAIRACDGEIILFIDEVHMIVGAGSSEGSADAANLLKPSLARGELQCLGATTLDEFRTHIEKDPALERRFQMVMVEEPDRGVALSILRGLKSHYEIYHGVQINDEALVSAVDLSLRYLAGRRLPDKAIDLLDEACSRLRMQIDSVPTVMDELRSQIDRLEIEKKAIGDDETAKSSLLKIEAELKQVSAEYKKTEAKWRAHQEFLEKMRKSESQRNELTNLFENAKSQGNFDFAAKLQYEELPKVQEQLEKVREELEKMQDQNSWLRQVVGHIEIADVLSAWTGIPVQKVAKDESQYLLGLEGRLQTRVFGQDEALKKLAKAVKRSRVGVQDPRRPLGVFLFLGPTGVGKTETVKALAQEVFDDESRMVRIDMSEYMEAHSVSRLIGSPPGYVGYGEGGDLSEPIRRTPYTVVLLDEIEKAHPRVLDVLLQIFDDGRLTDGSGRLVNFKNSMIVMTSNLPVVSHHPFGTEESDEEIREGLIEHLRPEFIGRIDEVISFSKLGRKHYTFLLQRLLEELNERLASRQFRIILGKHLFARLVDSALQGQFGGRAMRRSFQSIVVDAVSDRILASPASSLGLWVLEEEQPGELTWQADSSPHYYLLPPSG